MRAVDEIEGVTGTGRNHGGELAVDGAASVHSLPPLGDRLKHEVEGAVRGVDEAPAESVADRVAAIEIGEKRQSGVGVKRQAVVNDFAQWQVDLVAQCVVAQAFALVAGRQDQTETRRKRRLRFILVEGLEAIIEQHVIAAVHLLPTAVEPGIGNGVGNLVRLAEQRPFLGEDKLPVPVVRPDLFVDVAAQVEDVLHDARLLVVGFLNEKGIILNAFGRRLVRLSGGDGQLARAEQPGDRQHAEDSKEGGKDFHAYGLWEKMLKRHVEEHAVIGRGAGEADRRGFRDTEIAAKVELGVGGERENRSELICPWSPSKELS